MNMMRESGEKLIEAIAYGDAAGLPVETRSAEYIAEHYGRIDHLIPSSENPFYTGNYEPGAWSDDTQLSIAVARSLARANGFNIDALVATHIDAFDETAEMEFKGKTVKRGWGRSTTTSLRKLKNGVPPYESGLVGGAGNGILMKMAPLSYWHAVRGLPQKERYHNLDTLTKMTHDSPEARVTARIHDDVLTELAHNGYQPGRFIDVAQNSAWRNEKEFETGKVASEALRYLHPSVTEWAVLQYTDAKGFRASQSLAMAYGALIAHHAQFKGSVYGAVNLGGDTDSIASITAAMSILADGSQALPDDAGKLDRRDFLAATSDALVKAAGR